MAKFINVIVPVREQQVEISVNVDYIIKVIPDENTSRIYVITGDGHSVIHALEPYSELVNRLAG